MNDQRRVALQELQKLDLKILEAKERIHGFDPLFAEVEEPALILESELEKTRKRLQEMKLEERRLALSTEEKRGRQTRLDERLGSVRNLREEAAVSAELEMIKRAVQSDEQEAYSLLDLIRKAEERSAELEEAFQESEAQVEPARQALIAERDAARADLDSLTKERQSFVDAIDPAEMRLYDGIRRGGRAIAVSELTGDGACGYCFSVIPLQLQNEVRHGTALIRCEGCGVILAAPAEVEEGAEDAAGDDATEAAAEAAPDDAEAADGDAEAEEEVTAEA